MARRRRGVETSALSFLDCICCGFGAVILLLVITKIEQPRAILGIQAGLEERLQELRDELGVLQRETEAAVSAVATVEREVAEGQRSLVQLRARLASLLADLEASRGAASIATKLSNQLRAARQELTEEMERLALRPTEEKIGGVPVDSEYIVFIIDTSGSMQKWNWNRVTAKVREVLEVYPRVKGIQVMNDMGNYMYGRYVDRWIPDSRSRRRHIVNRLRSWRVESNSSPFEGIEKAIRTFSSKRRRISLYVFGDEFTGRSAQAVIDAVDRINREDARGRRRVRIHGVGFPLPAGQNQQTSRSFARLMRELCQRNDGAFVALAR